MDKQSTNWQTENVISMANMHLSPLSYTMEWFLCKVYMSREF